jgi:hypothetical protein
MIDSQTMIALAEGYGKETKDADAINDFFSTRGFEPELVYMLARVFGKGMAEAKEARKRQDLAAAAFVQGFGFSLFAADKLKEPGDV